MAATVAQWFTMIERSFVGLAEAMPAERYGFKPGDGAFTGVRTFGEQMKHVACGNFGFFNEIEKKDPPADCASGGPSPARTKAELVAYLRESFAYAQGVLRTMTAANALEPVNGPYGGVDAPRHCDARRLACIRSLRPAGRLPATERRRPAGEPLMRRERPARPSSER